MPNQSLTIIDSRVNSATGSSRDMSQCYCRMEKYGIPSQLKAITSAFLVCVYYPFYILADDRLHQRLISHLVKTDKAVIEHFE